ncbi:MAG TPA: hypothetical protein VMZ28_23125 [Kofleriaceae bacterium]|nr:hypothetical protein [Kofleriaceae bacterium]
MTPMTTVWIASAVGALLFFAAGFALGRRPRRAERTIAIPPAIVVAQGGERTTADSLSALLGQLNASDRVRALALADDLGLPIVGMGADVSSLAAFAGLIGDVGRKAGELLTLGRVARVTVEDDDHHIVTATPYETGDSRISLITLSDGPGPSARQVGEVLRSAASMIQ